MPPFVRSLAKNSCLVPLAAIQKKCKFSKFAIRATKNARKEGGVIFYAATNMRDTQEIVAGFNKFYPFGKVGITSLGGAGVLNKVTAEERAGVAVVNLRRV